MRIRSTSSSRSAGSAAISDSDRAPELNYLATVYNGIDLSLYPLQPSGGEDLGMAVRWAGDNAAAHGGDANRVYLMGHSAGATHVAIYVAHTQFHGPKGSGLAGAMFSSVGRIVPVKTRSVTSKTASRRFELVSSGPTIRKFRGFSSMMSRRKPPAIRVASASSVPGFFTSIA